jgi:transposase
MFARVKKTGPYEYLQIVQNYREGTKTKQRVFATLGRLDELSKTNDIASLVKALSRFSESALMVLTGQSQITAHTISIGPSLVFDRIWQELGLNKILAGLTADRKFSFQLERAIFLTVLHRLFVSGSDRSCDKWKEDFHIEGAEDIQLHHLYRAMGFLGEELEDQRDKTPFAPRCIKDLVEERLFEQRHDLFSSLDLVFFDTTSIYFEGLGGQDIGCLGYSKDHRPDLNQMVVGTVIDSQGNPICCELWPGNTSDIATLLPVTDRIRKRFGVTDFCVVADRGMISQDTLDGLEKRKIPYILGFRMRMHKEIAEEILSRAGRYEEVHREGEAAHDPHPLKVKEVWVDGARYILCFNERQARKDAADRQAILDSLEDKLRRGARGLIGNKGYRKYLKLDKKSVTLDRRKIEEERRLDGKWILQTNTGFSATDVALKYKELWQVEHVFRDVKSLVDTRPIYHKTDETIRGHVFCSFLALVLRKELDKRLNKMGKDFEWYDIKHDLRALQQVIMEENQAKIALRTVCRGVCSDVLKAAGVVPPPTIKAVT